MKEKSFTIAVKFFKRGDKIFQHFIFDKKAKILNDNRFVLYERLRSKIREYSLSNVSYDFLLMREEDDRVVLEFEYKEQKQENYYFTIVGKIPNNPSCKNCIHYKKDGISVICSLKEKRYMKPIKACKFYKQGEEMI